MTEIRLLAKLPREIQDRTFEAFTRIYDLAFPLPDERQDPEDWRTSSGAGGHQILVLLAGTGFESAEIVQVTGGIVVDYFPQSCCGLLSYIAVDAEKRGEGLAHRLLEEALQQLRRVAEKKQQTLRAVFGEAEDFRRDMIAEKGEHTSRRLAILDRLGGYWIQIPYVMPRLSATQRRDTNLLLMAFPHPRVTLNATTVPLAVVEDFLVEYFAQEQDNPDDPRHGDEVPALQTALDRLSRAYHEKYEPNRPWTDFPRDERQVPLTALPQRAVPSLHLRDVAVCFHIVTLDIDQDETEEHLHERFGAPNLVDRFGRTHLEASTPDYICPIYHSFEIDILSYRFQADPPVRSLCTSEEQFKIRIRFPEEITYIAEGMERRIVGAKRELDVRASLTASRFPATGVRIWHLALAPLYGESLTELDIIRLIAFYYREQEQLNLLAQTTFEVDDDGERRSFSGLLKVLSWESLEAERPTAGTIEFNPPPVENDDGRDIWTEILSHLFLTTIDDQDGFRALEDFYRDKQTKQLLDACCGIVSGIFDYSRMSFAEMQDTLAPDSSAGGYAVWLNRTTMTSVDPQDQMLERCGRTIGISPYLILPHAVLLHNEWVVDQVEEVARRALEPSSPPDGKTATLDERIARLARARRRIERSLNRWYIPNIFHYVGERELYDAGSRTRGALEKKQAGERLLANINAGLRDTRTRREDEAREEFDQSERRRGFALTFLSVLLSLTVVLDIITFPSSFAWQWWSIGLVAATGVAAALVLILVFPRSRPTDRDQE